MSFVKIEDPNRRKEIVDTYLQSRDNLKSTLRKKRLTNIGRAEDLRKLFKPIITEARKTTASVKELPSIAQALAAQPQRQLQNIDEIEPIDEFRSSELYRMMSGMPTPSTPGARSRLSSQLGKMPEEPEISYEVIPTEEELEEGESVGPIAKFYLDTFGGKGDTLYGPKPDETGALKIGDYPLKIKGDDIVLGEGPEEETFKGTRGLWDLLMNKYPTGYANDELRDYARIMYKTRNLEVPDKPWKARSNQSVKWKRILSDIWRNRPPSVRVTTPKKGSGTAGTTSGISGGIILPSDPLELANMLKLRIAASAAGNTGASNEGVAIADELLRQKCITGVEYKKILYKLKC
jgi:hypothetical protein